MFYVARVKELTKVLRVRVSPDMLDELVKQAQDDHRTAGAVARAAISSYLAKGKR